MTGEAVVIAAVVVFVCVCLLLFGLCALAAIGDRQLAEARKSLARDRDPHLPS